MFKLTKRASLNWGKGLGMVLMLLLLVGLAPIAPAQVLPKAQPILREMAQVHPDAAVSIIVQKTSTDASVEALVAQLGGTVTKDLSIINAFAAEIKVSDVPQLATASGVKWISLDAPMVKSGGPDGTVNTSALVNAYNKAIGADKLWELGYQGSSVTVALVDSGIANHTDLKNSDIVASSKFSSLTSNVVDQYGHGTHIAGIVTGDGTSLGGKYIGVAPKANLVNVKISNDQGQSLTSDVVAGLQWVLKNRTNYNIRVVNLSLNSTRSESYKTNPLDAAVEILWFNGIVVVVSAGNNGTATLYPPANDPFVITVGAVDDRGTASTKDDVLASFSAYGNTLDGFSKPDLVAPGKNIISLLANSSKLSTNYPSNVVDKVYFKMSGTSMASGVVAGSVALLLQVSPNLTPDQVKYRLKATANRFNAGNGAGYLNIYAAAMGTTTASANTGIPVSNLLFTGINLPNWGSVDWGSVDWGSVDWGSVDWGSVDWGSVDWGSLYWGR